MAEIKRNPVFWDPATGCSDDVVVKNESTTGTATVKRGMLLLSDGAGKYSIPSGNVSFTRGTSNRIAIALEDATIAKGATGTPATVTIKAIKSGVVFIEELYKEAGYTSTTAPADALDELGGISNIVFVHVKEA